MPLGSMVRQVRGRLGVGVGAAALLVSCSSLPEGPNDNAWRLLPGHVETLQVPAFRNGRQCWVYLPPGYATSTRRYPVLYMNDGQTAFEGNSGIHVNRICEDLIRSGEIEPIIVVAVSPLNFDQRFVDYTPWPGPYHRPSGFGDFYLQALRDTLKPEIDRRYRTLPDQANTAIEGGSLSGLIAAYAGFEYDSTFGKVAAFSPSYWWWGDGGKTIYDVVPATRWQSRIVKFYQDTGYADDNDIDYMTARLSQSGFIEGLDFMSNTERGGTHTQDAWEHRFPDMLRFLFPAKEAPVWPDPIIRFPP
ncbi:MAG TPA: alpha/beta hydrolase-fold protein [Candidatus Eisenbacteria bacterium]|nr:alpha/beta hydrolase-fold protein [Candidatus Eisenbacteria bacterium]